jgi:hypothetical protein
MKTYKYRLLKDLPEYPKDCVFVLNDKGWRGYWDSGGWTIPKWLEELLYNTMPEVRDELTEWLEPVIDSETVLYDVNIQGEVKERTVYDFWGGWEGKYTFTDKKVAEEKAAQIRQIFATEATDLPTPVKTNGRTTDLSQASPDTPKK